MSIDSNLKIIIALSIIGIIISGYLLYTRMSPYAEFPAYLGMLAFLLYIIPSYVLLSGGRLLMLINKETMHYLMLLWGLFSIGFYAYLTYLDLYVIYSICILCVVALIITIAIFGLAAQNVRLARREE